MLYSYGYCYFPQRRRAAKTCVAARHAMVSDAQGGKGLALCHLEPQQHRAASHPHPHFSTRKLANCLTIKLSNYQTIQKLNLFASWRVCELASLIVVFWDEAAHACYEALINEHEAHLICIGYLLGA